MLQRLGGAAFPFKHRSISEVLQIFDAHLSRPEAARSQIAKTAEEGRSMSKNRIHLRGIRKIIEHSPSLSVTALDERFVEPRAQMIDERQASAHRGLPDGLIDHHEVHEFRDTCIAGAAGPLIS